MTETPWVPRDQTDSYDGIVCPWCANVDEDEDAEDYFNMYPDLEAEVHCRRCGKKIRVWTERRLRFFVEPVMPDED